MNKPSPSRRGLLKTGACAAAAATVGAFGRGARAQEGEEKPAETVDAVQAESLVLPTPNPIGRLSLEEAIAARRSVRAYAPGKHLTIRHLSQLLWAAQGITEPKRKFRAAPSAGALYPMDVFAVLPGGIYQYRPASHEIVRRKEGDLRKTLADSALGQKCISTASTIFLITTTVKRCSVKYGDRAPRYCMNEAGLIAENVCLQVAALGLGGVIVGAFYDDKVKANMGLKDDEDPMLILPVGVPA
jgi:SagB-type dehydrogenase family enzyme